MEDFIKAGYTVVGTESNPLPQFNSLRELQDFIRNNNLDDEEKLENHSNPLIKKIIVQTLLTLPIDEKVNGYGLNFVGRNFARAKYAQKTDKELRLNNTLSKDIDTTENLALKGDNLDSLKILKSYYSGKIKCIYIDPPYNTANDEFVYPDKFDKEEAEVLGFANLSESDFARMDFSFKTKKSHNGWLAFMYPRLLLARDLLSKDGVIFISIDDNEQANLKLLCDDVFGEENFVGNSIIVNNRGGRDYGGIAKQHEYLVIYSKGGEYELNMIEEVDKKFQYQDEIGGFNLMELRNRNIKFNDKNRPNLCYPFFVNPNNADKNGMLEISLEEKNGFVKVMPAISQGVQTVWRWGKEDKARQNLNKEIFGKVNQSGGYMIVQKYRKTERMQRSVWDEKEFVNERGTEAIKELFDDGYFSYPKSVYTIKRILQLSSNGNDIILDFFAGSGTTGHAVMQLNAEDGGNRKFILCQIDEPIKEDKPAYKFCIDNNLPPVISSITIERLKRAGEKIKNSLNYDLSDSSDSSDSNDLFSNQDNRANQKNHGSDIGFKVFDSVAAPKLEVEDGQIIFPELNNDALSRIYNMIFTVGLDEPTQTPEEVVKDCIYKIGNHYYITNSEKISKEDFSDAVKNASTGSATGKVFIDGWTASLNGTLQNYKEDVKIVF